MKQTETQLTLRWFERQISKLDRRLRKADEHGRIAEVEDIRVRERHDGRGRADGDGEIGGAS